MTVEFTVPGIPTAWARAGAKGAIRFTPAKQRSFMAAVKTIAAAAMRGAPPLDGPLEMSVKAAYPWPKSATPKKRAQPGALWKTSRPDADNCAKIVADSLNGIAFQDDAQIASLHVWKVMDDRPGLHVRIAPLGGG